MSDPGALGKLPLGQTCAVADHAQAYADVEIGGGECGDRQAA